MKPHHEQLEARRLAASLAYSIEAPAGPLVVGQTVQVSILGRAVYDAPTSPAGVFSWGVLAEWNTDWLALVDVSHAAGVDWLPLAELREASVSTDAIDLGGLLDFETLPLSGSEPVELAVLTLQVVDGSTPGTLTGVTLRATSGRPSALLGIDELVSADVTGAWMLWDVARHPAHNAALPADVDGDGLVAPRDALIVVNDFLRDGPRPATPGPYMLDVDADGTQSTPADVLAVFAALGNAASGGPA